MSFRGELREFELPDILQLIASQKKAGWLKVIWKGRSQFIFFRDGKITSTKNPADETDPLETFVLRRSFLTEDQIDRVNAVRRKSGLDIQDVLHKEYLELLEKEITKAFVYSYQEQAEALFQNYLDHAEAFVNKTRVKDRNTREELQPDEGFLKSIEEQIAIIGSAAEGFRQEVIAYLWAAGRHGEKISYRSYEPLKEAIEKKLMTSVRDISRIITKARTRDEEQTEKYDAMVKAMLENGYCTNCVDVVLKYAANNLWKD